MTLIPTGLNALPVQNAADRLILAARSPATLCAYRTDWGAFVTWCETAGITSGLLFRSVDRHGRVGNSLSDRSVARIIKTAAQTVGLDPEHFSGHSLRAGFITSGAEAGADALLIAETSRHKNLDVLRIYVRHASLLKVHAGQRFL